MLYRTLALLLAAAVFIPQNAQAQDKQWALTSLSANFMREEPDYAAENGDQVLMGTLVQVVDSSSYWRRIVSPEPYTAWVNRMGLAYITEAQKDEWLKAPRFIVTDDYAFVLENPAKNSQRVTDVVAGDLLRCRMKKNKPLKSKGYYSVETPDGRKGWIPAGSVMLFSDFASRPAPSGEDIVSTAKRFIGVPYMWGGTSAKALDCSGLARTTYFLNGILLPRNASQQAKVGEEVPVDGVRNADFSALQPGDLLFFGNLETRKVTHVGIYIGGGRMIHSSQLVRINSLDPSQPDYYDGAKRLLCSRRILGSMDAGKGIVSIGKSPFYFSQD
jgi:cell wall-associated NlpC family hydrolase